MEMLNLAVWWSMMLVILVGSLRSFKNAFLSWLRGLGAAPLFMGFRFSSKLAPFFIAFALTAYLPWELE